MTGTHSALNRQKRLGRLIVADLRFAGTVNTARANTGGSFFSSVFIVFL